MIGGKSENENDLIPLFCYLLDKRDVKWKMKDTKHDLHACKYIGYIIKNF